MFDGAIVKKIYNIIKRLAVHAFVVLLISWAFLYSLIKYSTEQAVVGSILEGNRVHAIWEDQSFEVFLENGTVLDIQVEKSEELKKQYQNRLGYSIYDQYFLVTVNLKGKIIHQCHALKDAKEIAVSRICVGNFDMDEHQEILFSGFLNCKNTLIEFGVLKDKYILSKLSNETNLKSQILETSYWGHGMPLDLFGKYILTGAILIVYFLLVVIFYIKNRSKNKAVSKSLKQEEKGNY